MGYPATRVPCLMVRDLAAEHRLIIFHVGIAGLIVKEFEIMKSPPEKKVITGSIVLLVSLINPNLFFLWSDCLPSCPSWS